MGLQPYTPPKAEAVTYGVFLHSTGKSGGYVVRTIYSSGRAANPYNNASPMRTFKRKNAAQNYADKLNGR